MSKLYTFPTQRALSGVLTFEVTTSTGSGTSAKTEKYFSDEVLINNETEYLAGDLKSSDADFNIAYDKDDLFRTEILPVALTDGEFVKVKFKIGDEVKFIGKLEPLTIGYNPFYADNADLDNQKNEINFKCVSLLDTAKLITRQQLIDSLSSFVIDNGRYVLVVGEGVDQYYYYVTFRDLIDRIIALIGSTYSITYQITYSLTDYTFYGKGDGSNDGNYIYPAVTSTGGVRAKFGENQEPSLLFATAVPATGIIPTTADLTHVGYFASGDETFSNAYDFLVGALKSFGLYCKIEHTPAKDLFLTIGTRTSGENVNLQDVLSGGEVPMTMIARKKVNVTSGKSGNSYIKDFPNTGITEFSQECSFDFGNDLDFNGTEYNSVYSVMIPAEGYYFVLSRYIGLGSNYLLNPNMNVNLDSWTAGGSWTFDITSPIDIFAGGTARATLTQPSGSAPELSQVIPTELNDGIIFGGLVRTNDADSVFAIKVYSGSTLIKTETFQLPVDTTVMLYTVLDAKQRRNVASQPITKVMVTAYYLSSPNPSGYVWFGYSFLQRARKGTPQLVGLQIEDLFNDGNLSTVQRTLNGIQDIKPSDYFTYQGERYYIKKVNWQIKNHETEIEAINYPY